MKENRTSKVFRASFKNNTQTKYGGYMGNRIVIKKDTTSQNVNEETRVRQELQKQIRQMISERKSIEEIRSYLNKEMYKPYEQYFSIWFEDCILKLNPDIKEIIKKGLSRNKKQEEIIHELEENNYEVYNIYKRQIQDKIKKEIQSKEEER